MKLSEIATALNGKLVGKMENGIAVKAAIVIGFNMSSPKFQTPVKALGTTMNKIMQFDLVAPETYKVSDLRTKKTRTMNLTLSEIEKVLTWDKIESDIKLDHTLKIEKLKHVLYLATADHKKDFIEKSNLYAPNQKLNTVAFMAQQFEIYENALSILAERCLAKGMKAETLKVSESKNLRGGKLELTVKDGEQYFITRVIIASGIVQRPHYRYLFL